MTVVFEGQKMGAIWDTVGERLQARISRALFPNELQQEKAAAAAAAAASSESPDGQTTVPTHGDFNDSNTPGTRTPLTDGTIMTPRSNTPDLISAGISEVGSTAPASETRRWLDTSDWVLADQELDGTHENPPEPTNEKGAIPDDGDSTKGLLDKEDISSSEGQEPSASTPGKNTSTSKVSGNSNKRTVLQNSEFLLFVMAFVGMLVGLCIPILLNKDMSGLSFNAALDKKQAEQPTPEPSHERKTIYHTTTVNAVPSTVTVTATETKTSLKRVPEPFYLPYTSTKTVTHTPTPVSKVFTKTRVEMETKTLTTTTTKVVTKTSTAVQTERLTKTKMVTMTQPTYACTTVTIELSAKVMPTYAYTTVTSTKVKTVTSTATETARHTATAHAWAKASASPKGNGYFTFENGAFIVPNSKPFEYTHDCILADDGTIIFDDDDAFRSSHLPGDRGFVQLKPQSETKTATMAGPKTKKPWSNLEAASLLSCAVDTRWKMGPNQKSLMCGGVKWWYKPKPAEKEQSVLGDWDRWERKREADEQWTKCWTETISCLTAGIEDQVSSISCLAEQGNGGSGCQMGFMTREDQDK